MKQRMYNVFNKSNTTTFSGVPIRNWKRDMLRWKLDFVSGLSTDIHKTLQACYSRKGSLPWEPYWASVTNEMARRSAKFVWKII